MTNEALCALGWAVGQFVTITVALYFHQQNLKVSYFKAAPLYFEKEFGGFMIGIAGLCLMLFIMPDFLDSNINKMDLKLKPVLTWKERIQVYQRVTFAGIGIFLQTIIILGVGKGKKAIEKAYDKIG